MKIVCQRILWREVFLWFLVLLLTTQAEAKPGDQHQLMLLRMRLSTGTSSLNFDADWARARLAYRISSRTRMSSSHPPLFPVRDNSPSSVTFDLDNLEQHRAQGNTAEAKVMAESELHFRESPQLHRFLCECALSNKDAARASFHFSQADYSLLEGWTIEWKIFLLRLRTGEIGLWLRCLAILGLGYAVLVNFRRLFGELGGMVGR